MSARLKEMYQNEMVDAMIKKFGYKNIMDCLLYTSASDGGYSEYAAQELAKSQFDAMPGARCV